jgi:hypothetical protein
MFSFKSIAHEMSIFFSIILNVALIDLLPKDGKRWMKSALQCYTLESKSELSSTELGLE